ncbi:hypothetical protein SAMN04487843_11611 [Methylobacterium sp. ap11]|uniref:hypothetical protein n=1 Tax=Methylobacterium sp. ap11 TaxID=1761799 RepID=UPI0008B49B82|nr:hypothetical protein [Methylobacterium sp. ap11]SEP40661.1 hypothetical protein SAMN04487843_11611 [Methylobacterium sp. ap11]
MTTTSAQNHDREHATLSVVTAAFLYSDHLSGKARIGGLSDDDARRLLAEARKARARLTD